MRPATRDAIALALGAQVGRATPIAGGDINEAWEVVLADHRQVFVKTNPGAPAGMFEAEARGLAFLRAGPLRVPEVLAVGHNFLVLELLQPARRRADFDETLGRGLATLHRTSPGVFGLDGDNFIGRLPQANAPTPDWTTFYWERRLQPQLALASAKDLIDKTLRARFDRLGTKLSDLLGPPEEPARLHGDLWAGNLHTDELGAPCLIDPAAYGGHREVDLAMMRLFGGFSERVFDAYAEAHPPSPGSAERVPLYQLYPLLVHLNLFGGTYLGSVQAALSPFV